MVEFLVAIFWCKHATISTKNQAFWRCYVTIHLQGFDKIHVITLVHILPTTGRCSMKYFPTEAGSSKITSTTPSPPLLYLPSFLVAFHSILTPPLRQSFDQSTTSVTLPGSELPPTRKMDVVINKPSIVTT